MEIRTAACHFFRLNRTPLDMALEDDEAPDTTLVQKATHDTFQALQQLTLLFRSIDKLPDSSLSAPGKLYRLFMAVKRRTGLHVGQDGLFQSILQRAGRGSQPDLIDG